MQERVSCAQQVCPMCIKKSTQMVCWIIKKQRLCNKQLCSGILWVGWYFSSIIKFRQLVYFEAHTNSLWFLRCDSYLTLCFELDSKVFTPVYDFWCPVSAELCEHIACFDVSVGRHYSLSQCLLENHAWLQRWFMRANEDLNSTGIENLAQQNQIKI